ncbi:AraC family ligand binding domain-containing protein [Levilactobacillus acidifarinae]|uniref:HTH araC/xylS-type domain-containing protein n=1 Tax=Levilactobacillus acidifarinae DSM 19394 = JCM 15949 TaxID=1423715 RepID=A0A0R1LLJ4_9LACO|nr:AraC family ligand binding domain-containing protein [Levilactobacillus acidifarinae]KRK94387.1 hypothetical protein FD25_GL000346 [Levilactobacillus acidifarinae DSM 19394]GEO68127.1 hypothetical protein LAC03_00370 [Levilactobacillus acidifarinae]
MKYEFFASQQAPGKLIFHHNDFHLVPTHFHAAIEVNYVFTGAEDWVTVNGQRYRPRAHDTLVLNSNVPHAFTPASDRTAYDAVTLIYPAQELTALYPALAQHVFALNTVQTPFIRHSRAYTRLQATFDRLRTVHARQADLVGFPNEKALTSAFRAVYHTTPLQYRRQLTQINRN